MSNEDFISSFYQSSPSPKKEPQKKERTDQTPPVTKPDKTPAPQKAADKRVAKETKAAPELDFEAEFNRLAHCHDELQRALEAIYSSVGLTHQSIQNFLNNPNNFPAESYQKMQAQREALRQELLNKLSAHSREAILRREKKQMQAKRQNKSLGSRRKWMTMD